MAVAWSKGIECCQAKPRNDGDKIEAYEYLVQGNSKN
jgi:hypothetical protein